jgi:hypothetical protein
MKKECIRDDGGIKMRLLSALAAVVILLATASVVAADPATVNTTVNAIGASDDTGDAIADIQADDASGASPGGVSAGDGWYTADKGDVMFIDGFNTTGISGVITGVVLNVQYSVEGGYNGPNPVRWALDAGTLTTTGIAPVNGEEDKVASYDLYAQGVDTVGEISTLDVEFTNGDTGQSDAVSFDYVFVTVTYNNPPVAGTPQTYDSTTLESKTAFERNDGMFINVSVTDANGASDLDTALITISNTTGAAIVDNDTMIQDYSIGDGYVYNYSWTVSGDADLGTWTINVYANDTSDAWDLNSTTFVVQDARAPEWSDAQTNKTPICENDYVKFTANWTDDVALAGYIFSTNQTGTWVNSSFVSFSGTSDVSETTTQITATTGTTVGWRFYANDTSDNGNVTDIRSFVVQSAEIITPVTPFMIYGRVFYEDGSECNNSLVVNITNLNNSKQWSADTNASYNYYRRILANGTDLNATEILQFNVSDGIRHSTTNYTVMQENITDGGLFEFNLTLPSPPKPSTPFMIYGRVFYEDGSECNGSTVNVTNTNTSMHWQAETNASYNFYQLVLDTTNVSEGNLLSFNTSEGVRYNITSYTVTQENITDGGLFEFNLTLPSPPTPVTPFVIYGWVDYTNGTACDNPAVNITNTNTSTQWQAETNSSYNCYQLLLDTTNVSAGDVLEFNVTDGTEYNTTNHTVTAGDIGSGGVFDFNLTLPSAPATDGPTVDSITITPDDDGATSGVQINPNPSGAKTVTVSAVVSDPNGFGNINSVNMTDIDPDPAHGDPSPVTLVYQSGSGSGNTATYNGTFDMQFYDAPIEYTVTVTANDTGGSSDADSSTFNYTSCNAMSLDSGTIAFGSIDPGENNTVAGDTNMTTTGSPTVRNIGNLEIDVNITGLDMTSGGDTITKDCMDAQVDALGYSDLSVARCFDANMTAGVSSLEKVDFRLNVPYGTPVGSYNGSVTLTADTCGGS